VGGETHLCPSIGTPLERCCQSISFQESMRSSQQNCVIIPTPSNGIIWYTRVVPETRILLYFPKGLTIDRDSTLKPNTYVAY
jgi:hypothetical protein